MVNLFFIIASAILLVLSYPPTDQAWCAWVAFVPFLYVMMRVNSRRAWWWGYAFGLVFFGVLVSWVRHVTGIGFVLLVLYLSLYPALFGYFASRFFRSLVFDTYQHKSIFVRVPGVLFIASVWTLLEYVRSIGVTGFGWGLLGYSQWKILPVIQMAGVTGVWGVSFVIMMVNVMLADIVFFLRLGNEQRARRLKIFLSDVFLTIGVVILVLSYGYIKVRQPRIVFPQFDVSVIQGSVPQNEKWDQSQAPMIVKKYEILSEIALLTQRTDFFMWPETAVPGFVPTDRALAARIQELAKKLRKPFLTGAPTVRYDDEGSELIYNSALLYDNAGSLLQIYDKVHRVPFGEYIPLKNIFGFLPEAWGIGDFSAGTTNTVFHLPTKSVGDISFGVVICFEDVFPDLVRKTVANGAEFIINITNDAWFKYSAAAYQHAQASVFRAVENGVWVVRCANTGLSCFINPLGEIVETVHDEGGNELFVTGYATETIAPFGKKTFFVSFGDVPFFAAASLLFILGLLRLFKVR